MLTLIAAVASAVVSIITAIKSRNTHNEVKDVSQQVEIVKQQTNGDRDRLLLEIQKRDVLIREQQATIKMKDAELLRYNKRSTD